MSNHGSFDVTVKIHQEDGTWWAESGDWRGWYAAADTLEQLHTNITESFALFRPGARWMIIVDPTYAAAPLQQGEES